MKKHLIFNKKTILLGSLLVAVLLISSATAVPQVHSTPMMTAAKKMVQTTAINKIVSPTLKKDIPSLKSLLNDIFKNPEIKSRNTLKTFKTLYSNNIRNYQLSEKETLQLALLMSIFADRLPKIIDRSETEAVSLLDNLNDEVRDACLRNDLTKYTIADNARSSLNSLYIEATKTATSNELTTEEIALLNALKRDILVAKKILNDGIRQKVKLNEVKDKIMSILSYYKSALSSDEIDTLSVSGPIVNFILVFLLILALIAFGIFIFGGLGSAILFVVCAIIGVIVLIIVAAAVLIPVVIVLVTLIVIAIIAAIVLIAVGSSILFPLLGMLIFAIGGIIGGLVGTAHIWIPLLLVINIVTGGTVLSTLYNLLEKYASGLATSIDDLCQTLGGIPFIGKLLAFLLPGLPWQTATRTVKR